MADLTKTFLARVATEAPVELPGAPPLMERIPEPPPPPRGRGRGILVAVAAVVVLAALAGFALLAKLAGSRQSGAGTVRTVTAERREFIRTLRLNGIVEAVRSVTISTPQLSGQQIGQLVITRLIPSGTRVKKGDLLVEFDRQGQIKIALDKRAEYRDLVDQIEKKKADQAAAQAKDESDLKLAEDALQTAQLEMQKNEIISRIDAEKNRENFEESEARLKQLRATFDLRRRAAHADLRILEIQRDRARAAMAYAQSNSEKMAIRARLDGLVVLNTIWKGGSMGEVQEGDEVRPGVPFMQVVNQGAMEVRARVNQADISDLKLGMPVKVRLDAYPDMVLDGRIDQAAAIGVSSDMSTKVYTFAVVFSIQGSDPKLMPDLSAAVDVELERRANALVLPRDTVWTERGRNYVRVKSSLGFGKRAVEVGSKSDVEVTIESGLTAGEVVARDAG